MAEFTKDKSNASSSVLNAVYTLILDATHSIEFI